MRPYISLFLMCLAPLAISGQDATLEERRPLPNLPIDPPPQDHGHFIPLRPHRALSPAAPEDNAMSAIPLPDRSSSSSTSVNTEKRPERTVVTTVLASSDTGIAETTLTVTQFAQPTSPPATDICWGSNACQQIIRDFTYCYSQTRDMTDPNGGDGRSETFQRCLCVTRGDVYKSIKLFYKIGHQDNVQDCLQCMKQAGVDIDDPRTPTSIFVFKIDGFCNTVDPNLYDLLTAMLGWLKATNEPNHTEMAKISAVSTFADRFTSTSGMNEATTTLTDVSSSIETDTRTTTVLDTPWWQRTLSIGDAIPTEYLAHLPMNWPYTSYGVARRVGLITSFPLVNPNATTQTVAWLYHSLLWNPRPLYIPPASRSANATLYQPLLESWTPFFLETSPTTATGTAAANPETIGNSSSTVAPSTTSVSITTSTSVTSTTSSSVPLTSQASTTSSTLSETSTFTIAPPPKLSDPNPDSPPPSTTSSQPAAVPMRPTRTQDPVLALDPDASDKPDMGIPDGLVTGRKPVPQVANAVATPARPATSETGTPSLEELWGEVQSMRSRLGGSR